MSSGLKERLERLKAAARAAEAEKRPEPAAGADAAVAGKEAPDDLHPGFRRLGVTESRNEAGTFLLRRIVCRLPYRHGRYGLEELERCAPHLHPMAARQNRKGRGRTEEEEAVLPPPAAGSLLFLDTETTGLGVGAGNIPFMVGIGKWSEEAFVVEQGLIRHPGEEKAMLTWLTDRFRGVTHLVTYNGRTFDWPVLVGRYILNGWRRSGPEPGHLDLLHPSRALWKYTLPSCSLGTVEAERLGIARGRDVPGSLAPELYMRFLRDGDPVHLEDVYLHNEKDVLTLASLAVHFGRLLEGGPGDSVPETADAEETFRTGLWLERHGRTSDARRLFDALAADTEARAGDGIGWRLALAARYKKLGWAENAVPLWERAAALAEASGFPRLDAHLELAIHFEHRIKDYETALAYAEKALELWGRRLSARRASPASRGEKEMLERRIERLKRKLFRVSFANTAEKQVR